MPLVTAGSLKDRMTGPVPPVDRADAVRYGRYVTQAADCGGCHSAWEAPINPGLFGGGNRVAKDEGAGGEPLAVFSRNITPDPSGIPYYDEALFIEAMRTGKVRGRELSPMMPFVAFAHMPDEELVAMFTFLKTVPKVAHVVDKAEAEADCAACGQKHGGGGYNKKREIRAIPIDAATATALEGTYRFEDGYVIGIRREKGVLVVGPAGGEGREVLTEDGRIFLAKGDLAQLEPLRDGSGKVVGLVDHGYMSVRAERVP
jgi:hypothetical protein